MFGGNKINVVFSEWSAKETDALIGRMLARPGKFLGEGAQARVHQVTGQPRLVQRITVSNSDFANDEYIELAKLSRKLRSPILPDIKLLATWEDTDGYEQSISVMEKLEPVQNGYSSKWSEISNNVYRVFSHYRSDVSERYDEIQHIVMPHWSKREVLRVRQALAKADINFNDLHNENVMVRKNGCFVITDPVSR